MTTPTLENYKADAHGRLVPIETINAIDIERDDLVAALVEKAKTLRDQLRAYRTEAHNDIQAFADLSAEKYGAKIGGVKGNITLLSFDGKYKILRAINDQLVFDERLQAAKTLIDACIHEWARDSGKEIKALVTDAFQVSKQGHINTARVLSLRRMEFEHPKWKQAMAAISDSLMAATSKTYIRIYERNDSTGQYQPINLDLANA